MNRVPDSEPLPSLTRPHPNPGDTNGTIWTPVSEPIAIESGDACRGRPGGAVARLREIQCVRSIRARTSRFPPATEVRAPRARPMRPRTRAIALVARRLEITGRQFDVGSPLGERQDDTTQECVQASSIARHMSPLRSRLRCRARDRPASIASPLAAHPPSASTRERCSWPHYHPVRERVRLERQSLRPQGTT